MKETSKASMEAIILAGGFGSRMGEAAKETQKCLLSIDNQPIIGHVLQRLVIAFGSVDVKIGVGYKGEKVKEWVDKNKPNNVTVSYVPHQPGSEYMAYMSMEDHIQGDFVGMAGDVIVSPAAYVEVVDLYSRAEPDLVMAFPRMLMKLLHMQLEN